MHALRALAAAMAVAAALVGCGTPAGHGSAHRPSSSESRQTPPLHSEVNSQFTYTLTDLRSCQVADALAVAINRAAEPLRVTATAISMTGGGIAKRTFQIAAVRPGFIGEIAVSSRLSVLARYHLEPASGAVFSPVSVVGEGYVFVVLLRVRGAHPRPWAITGLTVRYQLRQKSYTAFFPQQVRLPPVSCP